MAKALPLAASLILTRPSNSGLTEVLLTQRKRGMVFSEVYVYPGGKYEPADSIENWKNYMHLEPDLVEKTPLTQELELNSLKITAIRETFEESGIFIGNKDLGPPRNTDFFQLCRSKAALPALSRLRFFTRLITPPLLTPRFDLIFFLSSVPANTCFTLTDETQAAQWMTPSEIVNRSGDLKMLPPQRYVAALLAFYPVFMDLMHAESLPNRVFPVAQGVPYALGGKGTAWISCGDGEYDPPEFLQKAEKGKKSRIWMEGKVLHLEVSRGVMEYVDRSKWRCDEDGVYRVVGVRSRL